MSRRRTSDSHIRLSAGHVVTAIAYGEDEAKGEPSLANGGLLHLNVQLQGGGRINLDFSRDEIAALVPTIVASAVRVESQSDTAERYLREFGDTMTEEQKSHLTALMEKIDG